MDFFSYLCTIKRNKDGKFYQLCEEEDKLNLFELTTFKALENIQLLASMNGMEFVMYKKKIEALRGNRQTSGLSKWQIYHSLAKEASC